MVQINIRDFSTIQEAIEECSHMGGGEVIIPRGNWSTGPLRLKSKIALVIEEGAVVSFSNDPQDYLPVVFTRWEGMECYNYSPLIYARDCTDLTVKGSGKLVGNGAAWWHWKKLQQSAADELCYAESKGIPVEQRIYGTPDAALRPSFIQFINCKNVLLEGFCIEDGPQWTIHPVYCEDVIIRDVKVHTTGPNTDGLNPDSCTNVLVEGCIFDTGDDCIAINSGMNEDGWRVGKPCKNVEIRNCTMTGGHGGVVIGSAVSGGVEKIYMHDCNISNTMQGIRVKTMRGRGGYIRNVNFENLVINQVSHQAIHLNMFYEYSTVMPLTNEPTDIDCITIRNITGDSAEIAVEMKGLPEYPLKNIILDHVRLRAKKAFFCSDVENLHITSMEIAEVDLVERRK